MPSHTLACGGCRWRKNQPVEACGKLSGAKVDWGMAHPMVGSSIGVELVIRKVHRKIFRQRQGVLTAVEGFEAFCDDCGIAGKGFRH